MEKAVPISGNGQAESEFTRNFRSYLEGKFGFAEWFENHKSLEKKFGPEPWPSLKEYAGVA